MFKSIFVFILNYGHKTSIVTERVRSQMQVSKMRFLQKIKGVTIFHKVSNLRFKNFSTLSLYFFVYQLASMVWPYKQNVTGIAFQENFAF